MPVRREIRQRGGSASASGSPGDSPNRQAVEQPRGGPRKAEEAVEGPGDLHNPGNSRDFPKTHPTHMRAKRAKLLQNPAPGGRASWYSAARGSGSEFSSPFLLVSDVPARRPPRGRRAAVVPAFRHDNGKLSARYQTSKIRHIFVRLPTKFGGKPSRYLILRIFRVFNGGK